jgi:uncharacterized membrane protein
MQYTRNGLTSSNPMKTIIKTGLRWILAFFFVVAGINHFRSPNFYLKMMPPYIPWHSAMIQISGVAEIALALLALYPRTRRLAGWGLIALLIAVFPANLYMYQNPGLFPNVPPLTLLIRLPIQGLLIVWAWWVTD